MCHKEFEETMKMHKRKISTLESLYNSTIHALPAIKAAAGLKTMRRTNEDILLNNTMAQIKRSKDELAQARHAYNGFLRYCTPINADVFKKTKQSLEADLTKAYEALRTAQIAVENLKAVDDDGSRVVSAD